MSDKKPDFDSLDLSKIATQLPERKIDDKAKEALKNAVWLEGKNIEDVSPEEMKDWIFRHVGITLEENDVSSAKKRTRQIDKVVYFQNQLQILSMTKVFNKNTKTYLN